MRAVILATGYRKEMEPLIQHRPTPLFRIVDKPILFHILEFLVRHEIKKIDIILHHLPEMIEEALSDGTRWGLTIHYHLARHLEKPFAPLRPAAEKWEEPVLLGLGDYLPHLKLNQEKALFMENQEKWSGWAVCSPRFFIEGLLPSKHVSTTPFLSTCSFQELKESNNRFLKSDSPLHLFPSTAHQVEPGIWISRAISLHPSATVEGPLFIGENCQIRQGVHLGPHTVVESNCIIDCNSSIKSSLICQHSYVGEALDVNNSIVDRNVLINLTHETTLELNNGFLLNELTPPPFGKLIAHFFSGMVARSMALLLLLLLFPAYLYMRWSCALRGDPMLLLPARDARRLWKTFQWQSFAGQLNRFQVFFKRLPLLFNVLRGEVHFVGVSPRSIADTEKLPRDWQKLYLKSKVGLITLADLDHGSAPSLDDLYAAEAVYATQMGVLYDFKLLLRWLKRKCFK